jgi:chromate transporter
MFILPSFLLMVGFSIAYGYTKNIPAVGHLFFGLNPAVTGLVAGTAIRLGTSALQTRYQLAQALAVYGIAVAFPSLVFPIIFLSLAGGALWGFTSLETVTPESTSIINPQPAPRFHKIVWVIGFTGVGLIFLAFVGFGGYALANNISIADAFQRFSTWVFHHRLVSLALMALKLGAFTFGGGYVMVPLMEHEVVLTHQWLSHREFMDGMALGQLTPGPVVITVTFIGYRVAGFPGAVLATIGVFVMPFFFTVWAGKSLEVFHQNRLVRGALAGVTPTAIALLAAAATSLGLTALVGPPLSQLVVLSIIALSAAIFVRCKFNPLYILIAATGLGWFFAP